MRCNVNTPNPPLDKMAEELLKKWREDKARRAANEKKTPQ